MNNSNANDQIAGLEVDLTVVKGRGLIAKDKNLFGKKTGSDPYVKIYLGRKEYGKTKVVYKSLNPQWDYSLKINIGSKEANEMLHKKGLDASLTFQIFDFDDLTEDDYMGGVSIPLQLSSTLNTNNGQPSTTAWYPVQSSCGGKHCKKASGELEIKVAVSTRKVLNLQRGNSQKLLTNNIQLNLDWQLENGADVDLDTSAVGIDKNGNILMDETVYFGDLINSNGSLRHSGDEQGANGSFGGSKREVISCQLHALPRHVQALYFILTVATPQKTLSDIKNASVTLIDANSGSLLSNFYPAVSGDHTALFLLRISRDLDGNSWTMSIIGDTDHTARDFGSLIPEIKGYSRDIVPNIKINPRQRIAIMRKGGVVRINDYYTNSSASHYTNSATNHYTDGATIGQRRLVFGLAWDITNGKNIDLDASAIMLGQNMNLLDIVWFRQLRSRDNSIVHGGDEREGDEKGDDEKIYLDLDRIDPAVMHIGFVINSFSGQELDDVANASCHLYDSVTNQDIAKYKLTKDKALDKHTGLVMASLYRAQNNDWNLRIISEPAHGRVAQDLVDELQNFLIRFPPPAPAVVTQHDVILNSMPSYVPINENNNFLPSYDAHPAVPVPSAPPAGPYY